MFRLVPRSVQVSKLVWKQCHQSAVLHSMRSFSDKTDNRQSTEECEKPSDRLGGFAKAFNEIEQIVNKPQETVVESVPFKKLLRNSKFIDVSRVIANFSSINDLI